MTKEISLTQNQVALVSDECFERINSNKWYALWMPQSKSYVAVRSSSRSLGQRHIIYMHREIMNNPHGLQVDHINHDTLDNRLENLRLATVSENQCNRRLQGNNTSGYKGVSWNKEKGKWRSYISINKVQIHLGFYDSVDDAYNEYKKASKKYHGSFSFIDPN